MRRVSRTFADRAAARQAIDDIATVLPPRRGVPVGRGPHPEIPETYSRGAVGWASDRPAVIRVNGEVRIEVTPEIEALEGRTINGRRLTLTPVDLGTLVDLNDEQARRSAIVEERDDDDNDPREPTGDGTVRTR